MLRDAGALIANHIDRESGGVGPVVMRICLVRYFRAAPHQGHELLDHRRLVEQFRLARVQHRLEQFVANAALVMKPS